MLKKGDWLIRRGIDETEIAQTFYEQDSKVRQKPCAKHLRTLDARARQVRWSGSGAALAEGVGLGVLGIGLPDIPIFLAGLLRGIYQIALSYGVDVREKHEPVSHAAAFLCGCAAAGTAGTAGLVGTRNSGGKRNIRMFGGGAERSRGKSGAGYVDCKVHTGLADCWGGWRNL